MQGLPSSKNFLKYIRQYYNDNKNMNTDGKNVQKQLFQIDLTYNWMMLLWNRMDSFGVTHKSLD